MTSDGLRQPRAKMAAPDRVAVMQAIALSTFAVLPGFMVGAVAVGMRADLGFGRAQLGLAVAWFFITTALGTATLSRVVEQLGVRLGLIVGAAGSAVSLLGIALAPSYGAVLAWMTVGGLANALSQPAVNALLSHRIPVTRLGFAFGIKQASAPASMLLGGLAVPTLSLTVGWRGAFVAGAVLSSVGIAAAWRSGGDRGARLRRRPPLRQSQAELGSLVIFAAGGMFGAAAGTALGAFLVDAAVDGGMAEGAAGLLFAATSACGLVSRPLFGAYLDRHPTRSRYSTIVLLLFVGTPGYLLLATGVTVAYVAGGVLAFVAGWGWTGLFHYTVVSQNPATPASSTGVIQTGLSAGAGLGPLVLGALAERGGYTWAWVGAATLAALGGVCFWLGRIHYRRRLSAAAVPTVAPALARSIRWSDEATPTEAVAFGVTRTQEFETPEGPVTLYRLPPHASLRARAGTVRSVLVYVEGADLELRLGTTDAKPEPGHAVSLPPNLLWTARNTGGEAVLLAVVPGDVPSAG